MQGLFGSQAISNHDGWRTEGEVKLAGKIGRLLGEPAQEAMVEKEEEGWEHLHWKI